MPLGTMWSSSTPALGPCTGRWARALMPHLTQTPSSPTGERWGATRLWQVLPGGYHPAGNRLTHFPALQTPPRVSSIRSPARFQTPESRVLTFPMQVNIWPIPNVVSGQYLWEAGSSCEGLGWLESQESCWDAPRWSLVKERNKIAFRISLGRTSKGQSTERDGQS